jgi:hypothetical protein
MAPVETVPATAASSTVPETEATPDLPAPSTHVQ